MSKYENGLTLLNKLHGEHTGESIVNAFKDVCPKMAEITIETVFGDVMQNKALDLKTCELTILASMATLGAAPSQLRAHTEAALVAGATKTEIIEVILQIVFCAGFPRAVNAILEVKDLLS